MKGKMDVEVKDWCEWTTARGSVQFDKWLGISVYKSERVKSHGNLYKTRENDSYTTWNPENQNQEGCVQGPGVSKILNVVL